MSVNEEISKAIAVLQAVRNVTCFTSGDTERLIKAFDDAEAILDGLVSYVKSTSKLNSETYDFWRFFNKSADARDAVGVYSGNWLHADDAIRSLEVIRAR